MPTPKRASLTLDGSGLQLLGVLYGNGSTFRNIRRTLLGRDRKSLNYLTALQVAVEDLGMQVPRLNGHYGGISLAGLEWPTLHDFEFVPDTVRSKLDTSFRTIFEAVSITEANGGELRRSARVVMTLNSPDGTSKTFWDDTISSLHEIGST